MTYISILSQAVCCNSVVGVVPPYLQLGCVQWDINWELCKTELAAADDGSLAGAALRARARWVARLHCYLVGAAFRLWAYAASGAVRSR